MKLFAFYLGGKTETSHVEVHDMRFAVGNRIEDCHESLRQQWWGTPESLHIDCWSEICHADGYAVVLKSERFTGTERLFFANLGGYDPKQFTELHSNVCVVAPDKAAAKKRALSTIRHWHKSHRDALFEIENVLSLDDVAAAYGLHVHLAPAPGSPAPPFVTGCYTLLNPPPA